MLAGFFFVIAVQDVVTQYYAICTDAKNQNICLSVPLKSYHLVQFRKSKIYRLVQLEIVIH